MAPREYSLITKMPLKSAKAYMPPRQYRVPQDKERVLSKLSAARQNNRLTMEQRLRIIASHAAAVARLQRTRVAQRERAMKQRKAKAKK